MGTASVLAPGGLLALYGPYRRAGVPMALGNAAFDADLRDRDPAWDLCEVEAVAALAAGGRFGPLTAVPMPVSNPMPPFCCLGRNDVSS